MSVLICIAEKEGLNISDLILVIFYTEKKYFLATFSRIEMVIFYLELLLKVWMKNILQHQKLRKENYTIKLLVNEYAVYMK